MRRTALVTGAAHGIGLATARQLVGDGMRVIAVDVDSDALAQANLPDDATRVVGDAGEPGAWYPAVADGGAPDVLVHNVARMDGRPFLTLPIEEVRRSIDVTVLGAWDLTRRVVNDLIAADRPGVVVFNLSLHTTSVRMCPDYSVAKAGLAMLVKELAVELGPHRIRVNSVSPGAVDTWSDRMRDSDQHRRESEDMVPLGRLGDPADIARAIAFLVDEGSSYVTGTDLIVDGGLQHFNWLHHLYGSAEAEQDRTS